MDRGENSKQNRCCLTLQELLYFIPDRSYHCFFDTQKMLGRRKDKNLAHLPCYPRPYAISEYVRGWGLQMTGVLFEGVFDTERL